MSPFKVYVALATLLAAGCARGPEVADVAAAAPAIAATAATPAATTGGETAALDAATIVPDRIVDANDLVARTPAPVICREMLKQGSNVIVQQCMTEENWKRFERQQAREAQEFVRMLQNGRNFR